MTRFRNCSRGTTAKRCCSASGWRFLVTAASSWLYVRLVTADPGTAAVALPWAGYAAIGAAAVAACLLATAAALPFVRTTTRPDALRTE